MRSINFMVSKLAFLKLSSFVLILWKGVDFIIN